MKKFLLIISIISMAAISCANKDNAGGATESLVTKNIPSLNKSQKTGTANTQSSVSLSVSAQATAQASGDVILGEDTTPESGTYNVLDRLYSTTWYQSESDYDDGKLETEETFIFFNENSEVVEREYENGVLDGRDEYSTLTWVADITVTSGNVEQLSGNYDRNACIVKNTEKDDDRDTDYEAYYLYDANTLYIVDGNNEAQVKRELQDLIKNIASGNQRVYGDKYILSVKAK
ncbi:hypothetical protein [Brachyspira pilosicoli]|uniref:hypothetical protein n=1 Tax=Brachyspira pilosicoli TaxID=52584 RepID=UPI0012F519EC|nr:hypothetical protein [Brachyspira pilosicoli]WIH86070.1 hypothetical protein NEI03_01325 [Brachyspira pilosicoli]